MPKLWVGHPVGHVSYATRPGGCWRMQTARCPFRPAGRQSLRLGRWDGLDDAEQALGVGVISPALFAAWGLQFQPVTKRHGLAALGIEALFEFAPGGTCIQARSQDGTNIHYGKPPFLVVPDAANAGLLENGDVAFGFCDFCASDHFSPSWTLLAKISSAGKRKVCRGQWQHWQPEWVGHSNLGPAFFCLFDCEVQHQFGGAKLTKCAMLSVSASRLPGQNFKP